MDETQKSVESKNFIHAFIEEDIAPGGQFAGMTVHTRFPPEPNGYLHIGHCQGHVHRLWHGRKVRRICATCAWTTPTPPRRTWSMWTPSRRISIGWALTGATAFYYASDYFEQMYECAVELIKKGMAYVCELTPEQITAKPGRL